jgi:hypothetical protein
MSTHQRAGGGHYSSRPKVVPSPKGPATATNITSNQPEKNAQHAQPALINAALPPMSTMTTKKRSKFPLKSLGNNLRTYVHIMTGTQSSSSVSNNRMPGPAGALPPTAPPRSDEENTARVTAYLRNLSTDASSAIAQGVMNARREAANSSPVPKRIIRRTPSIALTDQVRQTLLRRGDSALNRVDGPCTGGVYALQEKREEGGAMVAVFKPEDEETGAGEGKIRCGEPNPERAGMVIGGGACRERAAYVLDRQSGHLSGVPPTQLACIGEGVGRRARRGSIQQFCVNDGSVEDRYDLLRRATAFQAQRIGILDMRIFNTDRHGGNVLCTENQSSASTPSGNQSQDEEPTKEEQERVELRLDDDESPVTLVPIDHALTLPNWQHLGEAYLDWGMWPQAHEPWHPAIIAAVQAIDPVEDAQQLRALEIPETSILTMEICTTVLRAAVLHGGILTLADGAKLFERPFTAGHKHHAESRSPLELIVQRAAAACGMLYPSPNSTDTRPSDNFFVALDEQLDEWMPGQKWKTLETSPTEEPDKSA